MTGNKPVINVTKTYLPSLDKYNSFLKKVWESGWITNNGPLTKKLADDIKNYLAIRNIELVANGTLAIQLAIKALNLRGEIITTPYSYVATTSAIMWEGCDPVYVDINEKSLCINPDLIEEAITDKTTAILATHVYGYPCDVSQIDRLAKKYNLKVIYDAAHCFGVQQNGESLLSAGDCSILSFHATKLFHTGEGGAVISTNDKLSKRIFLMKKFGHIGEEEYLETGINAKMSELHAAIGLCVLPDMDKILTERKIIYDYYNKLLLNTSNNILTLPNIPDGLKYNYSYYPVIFNSYEKMMKTRQSLIENGIIPRRYFSPSLNTLPYLKPRLKRRCPVSESIADRVLCLPLYAGLKLSSIDYICHIIKHNN